MINNPYPLWKSYWKDGPNFYSPDASSQIWGAAFSARPCLYCNTSCSCPNSLPVLSQMAPHCPKGRAHSWLLWQSQKSQPWSTRPCPSAAVTETLQRWNPVERQGGGWTGWLFWSQAETSGFNFRLCCRFLACLPSVLMIPMTSLQVSWWSPGWCVRFLWACVWKAYSPFNTDTTCKYLDEEKQVSNSGLYIPLGPCANTPLWTKCQLSWWRLAPYTWQQWRSLLPLISSYSLIYGPTIFHPTLQYLHGVDSENLQPLVVNIYGIFARPQHSFL